MSALLFGTIALLMAPLPYRWRAPVSLAWISFALFWLKACCGVRFQLVGSVPGDESPSVILANHQSTFDALFLQRLAANTSTILKRELIRLPFFGWGLAALKPIPIDRGSPVAALKKVKKLGLERLKQGMHVLVFPEGTRCPPGSLGKFARGGADIAVTAGVPVVPIAHNAGTLWPKNSWAKHPGTIVLVIGEPIDTQNLSSNEVVGKTRDWIEKQVSLIADGHYQQTRSAALAKAD
jgi:1-acyl-sn-glycerol-3-phosphate acyltransferase